MSATTPTITLGELDEREREASAEVTRLERERDRLLPESYTDPAAADELAAVRERLETTRTTLREIGWAREELNRRPVEEREREEAEAQQAAEERADKLAAELVAKAKLVDRAATAFATAVVAYLPAFTAHHEAAIAAGRRPWGRGGDPRLSLAAALAFHLREADVCGVVGQDLSFVPERPLAQVEA